MGILLGALSDPGGALYRIVLPALVGAAEYYELGASVRRGKRLDREHNVPSPNVVSSCISCLIEQGRIDRCAQACQDEVQDIHKRSGEGIDWRLERVDGTVTDALKGQGRILGHIFSRLFIHVQAFEFNPHFLE
jgi:hypothetical protein